MNGRWGNEEITTKCAGQASSLYRVCPLARFGRSQLIPHTTHEGTSGSQPFQLAV